jgi:hypothetical protein
MTELSSTFNIVIVGLSLRTLKEIKDSLRAIIPTKYNIHWANVTEPKIDLLLIDHYFYDSPSIQKIIQNQKPALLKLMNKPVLAGLIENQTLYLPIQSPTVFQQWIDEHLLNASPTAKSSSTPTTQQYIFQELINPTHGKIFIFDDAGNLGIADTRKELIWQDSTRQKQSSNQSLNYVHAKANEVSSLLEKQPSDLRQWVWNLIWQSPEYRHLVADSAYIQLQFWPQPQATEDRRDILRIAACFQRGSNVSTVAQHLKIAPERVQQFISASVAAGLAHEISKDNARFRPAAFQGQQDVSSLRGFFNKLRKRFGL